MTMEVGCGGAVLQARPGDPRRQRVGDGGLRVGAEHEARDRDADLAGGDVAVERSRPLEDRQQPGREAVALLGQLADAAAAGADGGEFGGDVDGVDEDQRRDDEDGCENQRPLYFARIARLSRPVTGV